MTYDRGTASASRTDPDASARGPESFSRLGTVGVEEEFFVVDDDGRPAPAGKRLAEAGGPPALADRLDTEMYRCIVETKTPVCEGVDGLARELDRIRRELVAYAGRNGYGVAAAGVHPAADSAAFEAPSADGHRSLLDRLRRPQRRNTATGLHVHVGVDDADKAVWIANQTRWYLPVLLALSVNSPFHDGVDTGLASARGHVFGALPNAGVPPAFDSYDDFASFRETMLEHGSIAKRGQLWWDVRPNDERGTVEVRAPDAHDSLTAVLAFAEYVRALVLDLAARYEDGASPVDCRDAFLDANRWEAVRYGHDATFVDRDGEGGVDLRTVVDRECRRLDVDGIRRVLGTESGAARQRRLLRQRGFAALCDVLRLDTPDALLGGRGAAPRRPRRGPPHRRVSSP
ncbi:MAG: glutamate--cysteine ligase [Halosimplex sp.]